VTRPNPPGWEPLAFTQIGRRVIPSTDSGDRRGRRTGDFGKLSKADRLGRFRLQRRDSVSSSVEEKVIGIVSEQLNVPKEDIKLESKFVDDLKADSLDVVELVMEFEEEFEITIPDEDYEKIRTVGDAVKYITEKQGG
jgi:acyl carrier protein